MEQRDKHQLEGLLQARSEDLRRRPRRDPGEPSGAPEPDALELPRKGSHSGISCRECNNDIDPRRLRAMPRAFRCLGCQRAAERVAARS